MISKLATKRDGRRRVLSYLGKCGQVGSHRDSAPWRGSVCLLSTMKLYLKPKKETHSVSICQLGKVQKPQCIFRTLENSRRRELRSIFIYLGKIPNKLLGKDIGEGFRGYCYQTLGHGAFKIMLCLCQINSQIIKKDCVLEQKDSCFTFFLLILFWPEMTFTLEE